MSIHRPVDRNFGPLDNTSVGPLPPQRDPQPPPPREIPSTTPQSEDSLVSCCPIPHLRGGVPPTLLILCSPSHPQTSSAPQHSCTPAYPCLLLCLSSLVPPPPSVLASCSPVPSSTPKAQLSSLSLFPAWLPLPFPVWLSPPCSLSPLFPSPVTPRM